jgi:hypothetical protein
MSIAAIANGVTALAFAAAGTSNAGATPKDGAC